MPGIRYRPNSQKFTIGRTLTGDFLSALLVTSLPHFLTSSSDLLFHTICNVGCMQAYSRFPIHRAMLQDSARVSAYSAALIDRNLVEGKSVLEVGCGTGILSLMAAKARKTRSTTCQNEISFRCSDSSLPFRRMIRMNCRELSTITFLVI